MQPSEQLLDEIEELRTNSSRISNANRQHLVFETRHQDIKIERVRLMDLLDLLFVVLVTP